MSNSDTIANAQTLHPGVRPILNLQDVKKLVTKHYGFKVLEIEELNGYDDKNFHVKVEKNSENNNVDGYTFKIINGLDSAREEIFHAQTSLLIHLGKQGIPCPRPVSSKNGNYLEFIQLESGKHIIRMLEFINGTMFHKISPSPNLYSEVGKIVAKMDIAMKNFHHSAYENYTTLWMLDSVLKLSQFIHVVKSEKRRRIIEEVMKQFEDRIIAVSNKLNKGMIHGDVNEQNIVVENINGEWKIKAILDFGDAHYGCYLYELAIAITYMILVAKTLDVGGYVLAGFLRHMEISEQEFPLLKVCIAARFCQSLVLGAYTADLDPSNKYVLVTAENGWDLLEKLWSVPEDDLLKQWKNIINSSNP